MSDPNRIGGIRGPNGSTLDDVVEILGNIQANSALLLQELRTLNTRVGYLSGTAAPSTTTFGTGGLPVYLAAVLGQRSEALANRSSIFNDVNSSLFTLDDILARLFTPMPTQAPGLTAPAAENTAWFNYINAMNIANILDLLRGRTPENTLIQQIVNLLEAGAGTGEGGGASPQLLAAVEAIRDALGLVSHPPIGSTIKDLLRSIDTNVADIEECACGDGTTDPGGNPTPFPPPATSCLGETAAWQECTLVLVQAGDAAVSNSVDIYNVQWPAQATNVPEVGNKTFDADGRTWNFLTFLAANNNSPSYDMCVSLNFEGGTAFVDADIGIARPSLMPSYAWASGLINSGMKQALAFNSVPTTTGAMFQGLWMNIAFPRGTTVAGKIYVNVNPLLPE